MPAEFPCSCSPGIVIPPSFSPSTVLTTVEPRDTALGVRAEEDAEEKDEERREEVNESLEEDEGRILSGALLCSGKRDWCTL